MGYFANGTEGVMFREQFCFRCMHWKPLSDDPKDAGTNGCPIMDLHFEYGYELCNAGEGTDEGRKIAKYMLDTLITERDFDKDFKTRENPVGECVMFIEAAF